MGMDDLEPVAFDIETSGLGSDAVVTVAGFAHDSGISIVLNTDRTDADHDRLTLSQGGVSRRLSSESVGTWRDRRR